MGAYKPRPCKPKEAAIAGRAGTASEVPGPASSGSWMTDSIGAIGVGDAGGVVCKSGCGAASPVGEDGLGTWTSLACGTAGEGAGTGMRPGSLLLDWIGGIVVGNGDGSCDAGSRAARPEGDEEFGMCTSLVDCTAGEGAGPSALSGMVGG